jgi:hypothetical protein
MNVITVKNLKTPRPSSEQMRELREGLEAFLGPDDPLTASVRAENWPGRTAVHITYYVGLRTLTELDKLDKSKLGPLSWRILAGGHPTMTTAAGCMATYGGPGLPPVKVLAVTRGPAAAEVLTYTEQLNDLVEVRDNPRNDYELRVLRIPALGTEVFWLKSLSPEQRDDLVVPYGWIPSGWDFVKPGGDGKPNKNQAVPAADFLGNLRAAARQRMAQPDIAVMATRPPARRVPLDPEKRHLLPLPKPGDAFFLTGVYWPGGRLQTRGPASTDKACSEPDRVAKAGH